LGGQQSGTINIGVGGKLRPVACRICLATPPSNKGGYDAEQLVTGGQVREENQLVGWGCGFLGGVYVKWAGKGQKGRKSWTNRLAKFG